jgi:hypothetical protein
MVVRLAPHRRPWGLRHPIGPVRPNRTRAARVDRLCAVRVIGELYELTHLCWPSPCGPRRRARTEQACVPAFVAATSDAAGR